MELSRPKIKKVFYISGGILQCMKNKRSKKIWSEEIYYISLKKVL